MFLPLYDPQLHQLGIDAPTLALLIAIALALAAVTAFRPLAGCAGLILADPFDDPHYFAGTLITIPKVALLGVLIGIVIYCLRKPAARSRIRAVFRVRVLMFALVALLLVDVLSLLQADFRFATIEELVKLRDYAGCFVAAVLAGLLDDDVAPIDIAATAILALVALLAIAEENGSAPSVVVMAGRLIPRIAGPLEGPNQLAGYLQIFIPTVAALALFRGPAPWHLVAVALGSASDVLTLSRNGVLCGAVATAIVLVFAGGKRGRVMCALALGVVAAAAVRPESFARFSSAEQNQNAGRVGTRSILWKAAYDLWRRSPLLGIGAGNFELEIGRVGPPDVRTHANDWYLQSLVEGGIPSLAATLFTLGAALTTFAHGLRRDPLILAAFAVTAGLALASILDYALFYPKIAMMWWILLGLAGARVARRPGA